MHSGRSSVYRHMCYVLVCLLGLLMAPGCSSYSSNKPPSAGADTPSAPSEPPAPPKPAESIAERIAKMTTDEKIGQLLLVGMEGYDVNEPVKKLIETYHVGGFILYRNNIKDSGQLLDLAGALKDTNKSVSPIPLWLSVDEEGGRVSRMPDELTSMPSAQTVGKANKPDVSFNIGAAIGDELSAFGLNMNFAPVLDVFSNPKNTVIGDRSFGDNADLVGRLGVQTMKGLQSQKVASVVKHFPGHGDTSVDSHIGLPVVEHDLNRLRSLELKPFSEAVKNGADAVMVAHILLPKLDSAAPASFSKAVITDLLRQELGFQGVVITDDLTMGAVVKHYELATAAVQSVAAGGDILLVGHGYEEAASVFQAVKDAVQAGTLSMQRIDESVNRILKLKERYQISDEKKTKVDTDLINEHIRNAIRQLG